MEAPGLKCLSCKKPVQGSGKLFAEVFCCDSCFTLAARFMERVEQDLVFLRVMMKEAIRQGLLEGKLQFSVESLADVPKQDLLTRLAELAEAAKERQQCQDNSTQSTASGATTKPSVRTLAVGGGRSSGST